MFCWAANCVKGYGRRALRYWNRALPPCNEASLSGSELIAVTPCPSFLLCQQFIKYRSILYAVQDSNPRPPDIPTWPRRRPRDLDYYANVSLFWRRFVDIHHLSPTNRTSTSELHKVWWFQNNLEGFNSSNRNVRMIACRQRGDSRVWEQITFSNRHSWN